MLDPVLTEIKKLKSVRKQAHTGAFTREKILEKTRKYLVRAVPRLRRVCSCAVMGAANMRRRMKHLSPACSCEDQQPDA